MSRVKFERDFQLAPIILTGGIASNLPGGLMPITSLTQAGNYAGVTSDSSINRNDYLFDFQVPPGGLLIANQVSTYPFANQTVAANASQTQPLPISLLMLAPASGHAAYSRKLAVITSLKRSIEQHIAQGGTFTVATPSYIYTDCLLLNIRDASSGDPKKPQEAWLWEFTQVLVTLAAAQQAQNSLMAKITSGAAVTPNKDGKVTYTGQDQSVGSPSSGAGPSVVPAAQPLAGSSANTPSSPPPPPRFL